MSWIAGRCPPAGRRARSADALLTTSYLFAGLLLAASLFIASMQDAEAATRGGVSMSRSSGSRVARPAAGASRPAARAPRASGRTERPSRTASRPSRSTRPSRTTGRSTRTPPRVTTRHPPGRKPGYPPRTPNQRATNTNPDGGTKPPTGCRGERCPPTRPPYPPAHNPPRNPPRYPPPVVGIPPFTPPVPPRGPRGPGAPPPIASNPGGGGGQPPRAAAARPAPISPGGQPSSNETRYVPDQVLVVLRDDMSQRELNRFLRANGLVATQSGRQQISLLGVQVSRFRITDRRQSVPAVIARLQRDGRVLSVQPNYVYRLSQDAQRPPPAYSPSTSAGRRRSGGNQSMQYAVTKLQLKEAHAITKGERVLIAVIDSGVDSKHPELAGTIHKEIDVADDKDTSPHKHGTAMVGAIVSQSQLLGVAPAARVIAIRAFSRRTNDSAGGTGFHLAKAISRAVEEGARVINLSFAGPQDPLIQQAVAEARARGVILVAAAGNEGPTSPPMYPGAYTSVIAVTATDSNDRTYQHANRGSYIAVAAPGVDVMGPAPQGSYGVETGTSIAAAHITGVVALMLARNPMLDPDSVRDLLIRSARAVDGKGRNDETGAGFANAYQATVASDPTSAQPPVAAVPTQ